MSRLIFLLLVGYFLLKLFRAARSFGVPPQQEGRSKQERAALPTPLTACPSCGTFFQESQGLRDGSGRLVCSPGCAQNS